MSKLIFDSLVFDTALFGGSGELFDSAVFDAYIFDTQSAALLNQYSLDTTHALINLTAGSVSIARGYAIDTTHALIQLSAGNVALTRGYAINAIHALIQLSAGNVASTRGYVINATHGLINLTPGNVTLTRGYAIATTHALIQLSVGNVSVIATRNPVLITYEESLWLAQMAQLHGLRGQLTVSQVFRYADDLIQSITGIDTITITTTNPGTALFTPTTIRELAGIHGLIESEPLNVTATSRSTGTITQALAESNGITTVQRLS